MLLCSKSLVRKRAGSDNYTLYHRVRAYQTQGIPERQKNDKLEVEKQYVLHWFGNVSTPEYLQNYRIQEMIQLKTGIEVREDGESYLQLLNIRKIVKKKGCTETFNLFLMGCLPTNCHETIFNFEIIFKLYKNVNLNSWLVYCKSSKYAQISQSAIRNYLRTSEVVNTLKGLG